jgi:putative Mn2+ efflux pump MntP
VTPEALIKVAVVALSLGLDVFAVSVGVGMRGVPVALRWRIGLAFTTAEVSMTLIGAGLGAVAGRLVGSVAGYLGFAALAGVGIYMLVESARESESGGIDFSRGWGLFLGAVSISLDSLGIGFSLGLTIGRVLGARVEESAERWAGIILILTGLGFAALKLSGRG